MLDFNALIVTAPILPETLLVFLKVPGKDFESLVDSFSIYRGTPLYIPLVPPVTGNFVLTAELANLDLMAVGVQNWQTLFSYC